MKRIIILIICCSWIYPQETDSIITKLPSKAALYGAMFPGGGQVYNDRWFKAALIVSMEAAAIYNWQLNGDIYNNYESGNYNLSKHRYLEKRNKYAWWMFFIYVYGMLDAVVDAHLKPYKSVMTENIESSATNSEE
ncbi:MAG TPA: DUF5683 domain-containing protein [Candidatus Marinimicrobia bacterium]|jgi:hypothetical protein|nr:DUF5683 domain-containing protein [Candidatus Neomarinimicrobiota bacterium]MDP7216744.1 DUF5683 domain-containing protein [Candidatus Neomarinimicrobiota bacterium]HJL75133.1 DUF5683 domain-containing protein [Candidatus Neomarinimicrobiota bacterium]HJM69250.1 DUF5683 domain-containing protein [Candidatus Neomarinimicrobiota bacterium]|tara:strand:- start:270 stop:677 length:408 start_codon:yes stop_codon:yes gene_type:complete